MNWAFGKSRNVLAGFNRFAHVLFLTMALFAVGCSNDSSESGQGGKGSTNGGGGGGGADEGPKGPLPKTADTKFRPGTDGFSFPNYGGPGVPGVFDAADLRRMFGDKVCSTIANDKCTVTPQGQEWIDKVNVAVVGGHCEGFAVLSELFFNKWADSTKFGGASPNALVLEGNGALHHEIAYWYATQFLEDPVIKSTHSFKAVDAVNYLLDAFSNPTQEKAVVRIGIARIGEGGAIEGGHAITPYAVLEGEKPNTKKIMVYDNNWPGVERFIDVDMAENSWSYAAGVTPDEPESLYTGSLKNKNRMYIATIHPRLGVHECPFCDEGGLSSQGFDDVVPIIKKRRSLIVHGDVDPLVEDENGKRVGRVGGEIVNEVPGAVITPGFSGGLWRDNSPLQITLPPSGGLKVFVTRRPGPRVVRVQGDEPGAGTGTGTSVTLFGGGYSLGVSYPPSATVPGDTIGMPESGSGVAFTSIGPSSATLSMAAQTANGGVTAQIGVANLPAGANVGLETDANSGKVAVAVESSTPVEVQLNVGIDKGDGAGKQVFEGEVTSTGADSVGVDLGNWTGGTDPIPITVAPSDGSPPIVVVVENEHDYTPPPINECALSLSNCSINATCTDTPSGFACTCKDGYGGDGVSCELGKVVQPPPPPAAPAITYDFVLTPELVYTVGKLVTLRPPTNTGGRIDSYAVTPALPAGLAFDAQTGAISGTPTTLTAARAYTVSATNAGGTSNASLTIRVQAATPRVSYVSGTHAFVWGEQADVLLPTSSGGTVSAYEIAPQLPAGLSFDTTTGAISGVPTQLSPAVNYTVTASNGSGSWPCTVSISVVCPTNSACGQILTKKIGGTVSGLLGSGLVLQDNGGDDRAIASDGGFVFATEVATGSPYAVTVRTQPTLPSQTCSVSGGSGIVGASDISDVGVTCSTNGYTVGGTVSGLVGTVVLQNGSGNTLTVSSNGTFTFATPVLSGAGYNVTVLTQPNSPAQTCSVSNGLGTVGSSNVSNVTVTCSTNGYTVGGSISGLLGTVVLQNGTGNTLTLSSNGAFTFAPPVLSGASYDVTVLTQPSSPTQTCVVSNGSGTVGGSTITNVTVTCSTHSYSVGGTISGLSSTVVLQNGSGNSLTLSSNGAFTFPTPVLSGALYDITVLTQPTSPTQTCWVSSGSGTMGASDVGNVIVTCSTNGYSVGGTISGLLGTIVLQNGSGNSLTVSSNGSFTFAPPVLSGDAYNVTVFTQPTSPSQTCVVSSGSGTVISSSINNVSVTCSTNSYSVGGTISGLAGTVVLQNGSGNTLTVSSNGAFTFATPVLSGASYNITVLTQPTSPSQICSVSNGSGSMAGANVSNVTVTCSTNSYMVGGTISGLVGTVVLQNNAGNNLTISSNGGFAFTTPVASGSGYDVTVLTQPNSPTQTCSVSNGSGTVVGSNVGNVTVTCSTNSYTVGGTISGLAGTVVLQNNGGNNLTLNSNGAFTFTTPVLSGATYSVTVLTQPNSPSQTCSVSNGSGTMAGSNVSNVTVTCSTNGYTVGGTISGLAGTVVLQNNGGNNLTLNSNGAFTFSASVLSGATYSVTVLTQPNAPTQTCSVSNGTGTVAGSNISNVAVTCSTDSFTVGGTISGLAGSVVLQNNGAGNLTLNSNGPFTFSTPVLSGATYSVTVLTQPNSPSQTCSVSNGSGTMAGSNVSNVTVTCSTNSYTVGGTVSGLAGTVVLQNNGGNNTSVSSNGAFTFSTSVLSGATYNVTVLTQPGTKVCAVGNPSGTIATANVTNVSVTCVDAFAGLASINTVTMTSMRLNWADVSGAASYRIYNVTGAPALVQTVAAPATTYTLTGLTAGTTYKFRVRMVDSQNTEDGNTVDRTATTSAPATLIGYWKMDEAPGATTVADYGPNGLTGTIDRAATFVPGAGRDGSSGAVQLAANGSIMVDFPNTAQQNTGVFIPKTNSTSAMWFKTSAGVVGGVMVVSGGGCDRAVGNGSGNRLAFNTYNDINFFGGTVVNDGNWHHVAFVLDSVLGVRVYVDGLPDAAPNATPHACGVGCSDFDWATRLKFGTADGCRFGAGDFNGLIDDVRLYGTPLSDAQVLDLYRASGCPDDKIMCGGTCINASTNATYCGATAGCGVSGAGSAGTTCGGGQTCSAGVCGP